MLPLIPWISFNLLILGLLILDLGVFHRKAHEIRFKEAVSLTAFWIFCALIFDVCMYFVYGLEWSLTFLTGYVIEKSLSVDNIFVFLIIFSSHRIPKTYQHKVLYWGIIGALIMRASLIFAGVGLITRFHWIGYVFGAFLTYSGLKILFEEKKTVQTERSRFVKWVSKIFPFDEAAPKSDRFFIKKQGKWHATVLFSTLLLLETTDLVFALDSIPAILSTTSDSFIVYTSNVFAILGLRSLYFAIAGAMEKFYYFKYGLCGILVFVGLKMLLAGVIHISIGASLLAIVGILVISIFFSWRKAKTL